MFFYFWVRRYNTTLNDWPLGKQRVLFPLDPQCSLGFALGNTEGLGETKLTVFLGASHWLQWPIGKFPKTFKGFLLRAVALFIMLTASYLCQLPWSLIQCPGKSQFSTKHCSLAEGFLCIVGRHQANWLVVRAILSAWFDLGEDFSCIRSSVQVVFCASKNQLLSCWEC